MSSKVPFCFILMPFGSQKDPVGGPPIDFDRIYHEAIIPAIQAVGMKPIPADEIRTGSPFQPSTFEQLVLCDFAIADLTTANARVFYELGIRDVIRPSTTLSICAQKQLLAFDVNHFRLLTYTLGQHNDFGKTEAQTLQHDLIQHLRDLMLPPQTTSQTGTTPPTQNQHPLFQLLTEYPASDIARLKTDVFRERVHYAEDIKHELATARREKDRKQLQSIQHRLGDLDNTAAGVCVDLLLSYRAIEAWDAMVALYEELPETLKQTVLVREQLAFAHNRLKHRHAAEQVLLQILEEQGPSSETYSLLGRIYKDLWQEAQPHPSPAAQDYLDKAIASYLKGFEADWRDAYPGINTVTLLEIKGTPEALAQQQQMLPVVLFAVNQRFKSKQPDYWDHATLLELHVLGNEKAAAQQRLAQCLAAVREPWEPKTTANNLRLIRAARQQRGETTDWLDEMITDLEK